MGGIFSRILGSKTTLRERLERVDKELRNIQRFQFDTELSQKRWIGRLMIVSSLIYILSGITYYFFGPRDSSWKGTILYVLPFVIFPFLIWGLRRAISWYYKQKIGNNVDRYKELKAERQRLLEDVMEFETFNNAKEILEKYDPNRLLPKYLAEKVNINTANSTPSSPLTATPTSSRIFGAEESILRRRNLDTLISSGVPFTPRMRPMIGNQGQFLRQTTNVPAFVSRTPAIMPARPMGPGISAKPQFTPIAHFMPRPQAPVYMTPQPPGNPTLHNRSTGWLDKLVDYVVGDGPANRYALICKYCATHNGLATPGDFPYVGYRCVFCRQYNPPRQVRPAAEKLPTASVTSTVEDGVVIEEIESDRESATPKSVASAESPQRKGEPVNTDENEDEDQKMNEQERPSETFEHCNVTPLQSELDNENGAEEQLDKDIIRPTVSESAPIAESEGTESVSSGDNEPFEFVETEGPSSLNSNEDEQLNGEKDTNPESQDLR